MMGQDKFDEQINRILGRIGVLDQLLADACAVYDEVPTSRDPDDGLPPEPYLLNEDYRILYFPNQPLASLLAQLEAWVDEHGSVWEGGVFVESVSLHPCEGLWSAQVVYEGNGGDHDPEVGAERG